MTEPNPPSAADADNPFFQEWTGPFGAPPFGRIAPAHFPPAFDRAFAAHDAEVAAIAADPAAPSFDNTIAALELSGRLLGRVTDVFRALAGAHTNAGAAGDRARYRAAPRPPLGRHPAQRAPCSAASTRSTARATGSA